MVISSKRYYGFEQEFIDKWGCFGEMNFAKDDRLSVAINVFSDNYRQDIDSYPKTLFDCLEKSGLIYNDNRIDELYVRKQIIKGITPLTILKINKLINWRMYDAEEN